MERIRVKWWFGERQKSLSTYNFLDDEIKESHIVKMLFTTFFVYNEYKECTKNRKT